jgi:hypothetical protein
MLANLVTASTVYPDERAELVNARRDYIGPCAHCSGSDVGFHTDKKYASNKGVENM